MARQKKEKEYRLISLRAKSTMLLVFVVLALSVSVVYLSYRFYSTTMDGHYKTLTSHLAKTVALQLDADDLLRYYNAVKEIGEYDEDRYQNDAKANAIKDERYEQILDLMFEIKECNDIAYLYVQKLDGHNCTYILDADHTEDQCQLGTTHEVSGPTKETPHPENGIPAFITNDAYGWLCTSMEPVRDDDGNPVALVGVDVSMDKIMEDRADYLRETILIIGLCLLLLNTIIVISLHYSLIRPIQMLTDATRSFVKDRNKGKKEVTAISQLNIRTGDEVETLCDSIQQMEMDLNNYIVHLTTVTAEKERIGAELDLATHIQFSMLPSVFPAFPNRPEFDIFASMNPAKEVGGDFYDFFMVDDRHVAIVMADVSGKGVPAALFMVIGKTLIKDRTLPNTDLGTVFTEVNNILCESNSEDLFITAFEGVLDLVTGEFRFVNAGHELPFIYRKGGRFEPYKIKSGFVLAGMEDIHYKGDSLMLEPGDKIFLYTDGVPEATNADNALYGMSRLENILNQTVDKSPISLLPAVKADIDAFVGDVPQFDDITMLCLTYIHRLEHDGTGDNPEENGENS